MGHVLEGEDKGQDASADPKASHPAPHDAPVAHDRVEVVTDYDEFIRLQPAWDALAEKLPFAQPFLSHTWVRTWWECFGAGKELRILLVKKGEELKAIAPLMLSRERMYGLRVRRLGFLYNYHTPRCDLIVARDAADAYEDIWKHLRGDTEGWDVLDFCQLRADSRTLWALPELADGDGFLTGTWETRPSPYVRIGEWESYYGGLSRHHRGQLRNKQNHLAKVGRVEFEEVRGEEDMGEALCDGFRIEEASWKGARGTAIACHSATRQFYTRLAERAAALDWLRLQFLTLNRRRIAFGYSLQYEGNQYWLKLGCDPAYARSSPGNLLCLHVLREAFERGLREFDFVGVDDEWKLRWTSQRRPHSWFYVFSNSPSGRLLHRIKFRLLPWLKEHWPRNCRCGGSAPGSAS